jgi:hypothetical protein
VQDEVTMSDTAFIPPVADELCAAIRQVVDEHKTYAAFFAMTARDINAAAKFFPSDHRAMRTVLLRLLDDDTFAATFHACVSAEQKALIEGFVSALRLFCRLEPNGSEWFVNFLMSSMTEVFDQAIPRRANAFVGQFSRMYLDSFTERLHVRSVAKLMGAAKALGGERALVRSDTLVGMLIGVEAFLRSLMLADSEIEVLKTPATREEHQLIATALDDIEKQLGELRTNLTRLKA